MRERHGLSQAFAENHPADAAQVLEALPVAGTAAFLGALPAKTAAAVARRLPPDYAAHVLETLDPETAAGLVDALGPQAASAALTRAAPATQALLLERVPVATAVAVRLLVGYPQDTAGARMDPWTPMLPAHLTVAEATAELKDFDGELGEVVFVVTPDHRLLGWVGLGHLLRASPHDTLDRVMKKPAPAVSALTPLSSLVHHAHWNEHHLIAVVERDNRLVGALKQAAVANASPGPGASAQGAADAMALVATTYWQSAAALMQLAVSLLPAVPPVGGKGRRDGG
ncbi:MAG: magnesium transporter MgtE N-terminal domain-containing protein [Pseudomonadota bacterium]